MLSKRNVLHFLQLSALLLVGAYLVYIILPIISSPEVIDFIERLGPIAPLGLIFYVVISHIFAPIAGTPGFAIAVSIFGIHEAMFLYYVGSLVSASINFYISRRFGRYWLGRFLGVKAIKEIDNFAKIEGTTALKLARVFGFPFFDVISYAAGLTKVEYKTYMRITALYSLIPNIILQLIFRKVDFSSPLGVYIWIGSILAASIFFGALIRNYIKKRQQVK